MKDKVEALANYRGNAASRLDALLLMLSDNDIDFKLNRIKSNQYINVSVQLGDHSTDKKVTVLGAHYDVYKDSLGYNDNTCAVIMLIKFIINNKDKEFKEPVEIVFFDKEESGMIGSYYYVKNNKHRIAYALIFDIIAFGDQLVFGTRSSNLVEKLADIKHVARVLPSDNLNFINEGIDVALITAVHNSDLIYKHGAYHFGIEPKFYKSFHNRELDNDMDILNFDLLDKSLDVLSKLLVA